MEPALPMPPVEELDVMFSELVVSLRLHPRRCQMKEIFVHTSISGWDNSGCSRAANLKN